VVNILTFRRNVLSPSSGWMKWFVWILQVCGGYLSSIIC